MNRPETTAMLSRSLEHHINPNNDLRIYTAKEVTFDYGTDHAIRVDYMRFKPVNNSVSGIEQGCFYCYEIKSSVSDFRSKNGHNFIGDYNYYVMPEEVYESVRDEIPWAIGALIPDIPHPYRDCCHLKVAHKAKRRNRERPVSEMLLMMFRSANRDIQRAVKKREVSTDG